MKTSEVLMAYLRGKGIDKIFFLPGGGAMHLNDALATSGIDPVHCHHEQACVIAAEAWGRMKGMAGVAMVTTGPGATNALTPVAGSWIESCPLIVLSGQVKRADLKGESGVRQKGVQEVDVIAMAAPVCKLAATAMSPSEALLLLARAWAVSNHGRKGPCWIDVPLDVQGAPYPGDWEADAGDFDARARAEVDELDAKPVPAELVPCLDVLAELAASASRPLFLVGHGVRLAGMQGRLAEVARAHGIPCVFTWNAMDAMDWDDPLNAGRPGVVAPRCANFTVQRCDLLIAVGARMDNIVTAYSPRGFARSAKKVVFDIDQAELAKLEGAADLRWISGAEDALTLVDKAFARVEGRGPSSKSWVDWIGGIKRRYPARDGAKLGVQGPIGSPDLAQALSAAMPEGALIATGSSGLCVESFYLGFQNKSGQRVFLTSGLGAMGYGLSAALGACEASPGRFAALVESDGSMMMNIQELATIKGRGLDLAIVLMDNAGYASIRATQRNYFQERYIGTGAEAGVAFCDWRAMCAAFGIRYDEALDLSELPGALGSLLDPKKRGPRMLRVQLLKDESLWPKGSAIPQADGSMISMPLEDMSPLLPLHVLSEIMSGDVVQASISARQASSDAKGKP